MQQNHKKICSTCKQLIEPKEGSLSKAFRHHVEEFHRTTSKFEHAKLTAPGDYHKVK